MVDTSNNRTEEKGHALCNHEWSWVYVSRKPDLQTEVQIRFNPVQPQGNEFTRKDIFASVNNWMKCNVTQQD